MNQEANQVESTENKQAAQTEKEHNMAKLRQIAEAARSENEQLRQEIERIKRATEQSMSKESDDDSYDEPYVDDKRLEKRLSRFEVRLDEKIDQKADLKARKLFEEYQEQQWLKSNPDYEDVMSHAEKFASADPELAETILKMPKGFERNKLVYKTIKAMNIHKPAPTPSSVQSKIEQNKRSPFYSPSDIANAPYQTQGDFSQAGKEAAFRKMRELQNRLRG